MNRKTIVRVVGKVLIPFIALFAFYTQFHGDYGPGGGFQAGVILASIFVLYGLLFGVDAVNQVVGPRALEVLAALGVLIFAGVGVLTLALGGNFLDYNVLDPHDPVHGQHLGVILIEAGVGITVTSVMIAIFTAFASRGREL